MMTTAFALLAIGCVLTWRRMPGWAAASVLLALAIGIAIFAQDVDFSTNLGIQL